MKRKRNNEAFTLIELMIVVAIVGILAVLAIYGVRKYLANAKTAEVRNSLGQVAKDQASQYEKESMNYAVLQQSTTANLSRALCGAEPGNPVPATASIAGKKYQSSPADWNSGAAGATGPTGFACLLFTMDQPQYYSYSFTSTGTAGAVGDIFTATGNGDLNGDGVLSTFSVTGAIGAGSVLNIAPNMQEVNPEE